MILLVAGVLLWSAVHLSPSLVPGVRRALVARIGEFPYRGAFALCIAASVALMAAGWRAHAPAPVYAPPSGAHLLAAILVFAALFLFAAAFLGSRARRVFRHPQLTGFALWAAAHLAANGDDRALVLFGGLGLWALLQMPALNRRDGARPRPAAPPLSAELRPLAAAAALFAALFLAHPFLSGVALGGGG